MVAPGKDSTACLSVARDCYEVRLYRCREYRDRVLGSIQRPLLRHRVTGWVAVTAEEEVIAEEAVTVVREYLITVLPSALIAPVLQALLIGALA